MAEFELILLILVVVAIIVTIARKIGIPYPILLVVGGLGIGLMPGVPRIQLDPDLALVVFLPPLIMAAAWQTPIRDLRANRRPILLLSVGLVLFTMVVVGLVAKLAVPGLPIGAALALGAIVAPPDAVAATSVLRRLSVPRRLLVLLETESLLNDATAITAYRLAIVAATTGTFALSDAAARFVLAAVGGVAVGLAVAWVAAWIWARLFDPPVEVTLSLLIPYAAFLPAEQIGASGVIATVTCGLYLGVRSSRILASDARILAGGVWQILVFVLNGLAFILVGLQLPLVMAGLANRPPLELIAQAVAVCLAVVVTRFLWIYPATYLPRLLVRGIRDKDPAPPLKMPLVLSWAGMRGVVSLALALALPVGFPERHLLLFLTFAVILTTLVGQGLTLPFLLRRLGLSAGDDGHGEEEFGRSAAIEAALARLAELRDVWPGHIPLIETLESKYRHRLEHFSENEDGRDEDQERIEHRAILSSVIGAEREAVIGLRDSGAINDDVLRLIERELDLEELRLEADI
ncbi:MAG: monovalent cation/hydrogen antiporter [Chloroflexota bacterium]|jgi:CPA1 family monovalent cation:H+ antiporter|nr:monovalent cation/hydrogen antiporter [Chloroflexota bacterium]